MHGSTTHTSQKSPYVGYPGRTLVYDSLKRLTSATNPESGTVGYAYDANGNLTSKTDARGITTSYAYDALNRVTSRSYSDLVTPAVNYIYDALSVANSKGRLTQVSSSVSTTNYSGYDAMGRVTGSSQTTSGQTYSLGYSYDLAGNLRTQTYPSGRIVTTNYDAAGRINSVNGQKTGEANKTYASLLSYAPQGAVASISLGNGLSETTNFNTRLQPTSISLGTLATFGYSYGTTNNSGNVLSQAISAPGFSVTQNYSYDPLNRLTSVNESGIWSQSYGYDQYGNRTSVISPTYMPTFAPAPAINAANNRINDANFIYDAAGNLTQALPAPGAAAQTLAYDAENKLVNFNSGAATYSYDGNGRRVKKVVGSTTTVFVYNVEGQLIAEYTTPAPATAGGTSYLTADHLGSTRVVTNSSGTVIARHDYLPFGEEIPSSIGGRTTTMGYGLNDGINQKFTAKERDSESGLDNFGVRYNASSLGRFMSPDPKIPSFKHLINPQKWNKYAYTLNNPLRYFDPDGMEEITFQIRAMIQAQSRPDPLGRTFAGDNRGFSTAANASSRTSISVRIETDASKRPGNPIISVTPGTAGQTKQLDANGNVIKTGTATTGLPTVAGTRDANGNAVLNFQENTKNPLEPQSLTPGIRADLNVTVPQNASSVTTVGTISGTPSFELNVSTEGGADVNIPLQTEPASNLGFMLGLTQTNSILNVTPLPPRPPACAPDNEKSCNQ